jgi:hypothetical protein
MDREKIKTFIPLFVIFIVLLIAFWAFFRSDKVVVVEEDVIEEEHIVEEDIVEEEVIEEEVVITPATTINRYGFSVLRPANWYEGNNRPGSVLTVYRNDGSAYYAVMLDKRNNLSLDQYRQKFLTQAPGLVPGLQLSYITGSSYILQGGGSNYVTAIAFLPTADDRVWVLSFNAGREQWPSLQSEWESVRDSFILQ